MFSMEVVSHEPGKSKSIESSSRIFYITISSGWGSAKMTILKRKRITFLLLFSLKENHLNSFLKK